MQLISHDNDESYECPACHNHSAYKFGAAIHDGFAPIGVTTYDTLCLRCGNVYDGKTRELLRNDKAAADNW